MTTTAEGPGRVNPSELLRKDVPVTSAAIATER
jgi:hypothetical protein